MPRAPACRRKFTKIYEIPRARAARAPCADKCQHRKWPLAHERPRLTQKFPSGVIHQKLRLELIQHAGYLVMGLRCVFVPFLMDPDACREPAHGAHAPRARGIISKSPYFEDGLIPLIFWGADVNFVWRLKQIVVWNSGAGAMTVPRWRSGCIILIIIERTWLHPTAVKFGRC